MRYERVTTGIYGDARGALHLDVPALLHRGAFKDTPAGRRLLAKYAIQELRAEGIACVIVARLNGIREARH